MNSKPIAVGLVFGVGMALALDNWLLGIMLWRHYTRKKTNGIYLSP